MDFEDKKTMGVIIVLGLIAWGLTIIICKILNIPILFIW